MQEKKAAIQHWVESQLNNTPVSLFPLKSDASFRSYYRVKKIKQGLAGEQEASYVLMYAPPERERTDAFVNIARAWHAKGFCVPVIYAHSEPEGYVLLSDFGDTLLSEVLNAQNVDVFYRQGMDILLALQRTVSPIPLPLYDTAFIKMELALFREWYVVNFLKCPLTKAMSAVLADLETQLIDNFLVQKQVIVHRDFHSRNLMLLHSGSLGIIDFQDAMYGPITYDLVSLLKDCYIAWPREKVMLWVRYFFEQGYYQEAALDYQEFVKYFDWTGLQRHLKVLGIFARLKLRDNKPDYIKAMPRILAYITEVCALYPALHPFHGLLEEKWFELGKGESTCVR